MAEWKRVLSFARFPEGKEPKRIEVSEVIDGDTTSIVIAASEGRDKRILFNLTVGEMLSLSELLKAEAKKMIEKGALANTSTKSG